MTHQEIITILSEQEEIENIKSISFDFEEGDVNFPVIFQNCCIDIFQANGVTFNKELIFRNCKINEMQLQGITAKSGITVSECMVNNYVDMATGQFYSGAGEIVISDNLFKYVVTFEDCVFHSPISVLNNTFDVGCDLLTEKQLACYFPEESVVKSNLGILNLSSEDEDILWKKIQ